MHSSNIAASSKDTLYSQITDTRAVWLAFIGFIVLTTFLAVNHVMWRDEVGALTVATHARSWADLMQQLHTEAHPILWYAILRVGYALTHSSLVLPGAALVVAALTAFLILRYAPFPIWARLLIVFGAFLGHEYSVIARNYGIGVLLMVCACILFRRREDRPLLVGLTLVLMANTSLHAALSALVILLVWALDSLGNRRSVSSSNRWVSVAAMALVVAGVAFAVLSSRPSSNMAYAFRAGAFGLSAFVRVLVIDPGAGLRGASLANIAAAGEIPWTRLHLDPVIITRLIVDISLISVAVGLWRNRACFIGLIAAILGFEVLFSAVYTGSLRHQGILTFLIISLCWIASDGAERLGSDGRRRSIAFGMLPLLTFQTIALPVIVRRDLLHPISSSKSLAQLIQSNPRYRNAILIGEPDFIMEPLQYYVPNPIYFPRERTFGSRVYFDSANWRGRRVRLGALVDVADSLACASGRVVLVSIRNPQVLTDTIGEASVAYGGRFSWNAQDRSELLRRAIRVDSLFNATGDENYNVFEISPEPRPGCAQSK